MEMGICFGTSHFLLKFMLPMARDRSNWPQCLLWHGWLPGLSVAGERTPLADSLGQLVDGSLESVPS